MIPTHKTVTVIGDAIECARRGMPVFVVDPKRVEFMGLRTWPNVQYVATTVQQQIALIYKLKMEMDERYRLVEEEGLLRLGVPTDPADHRRVPAALRQRAGLVEVTIKVTGMCPPNAPIFQWIGSLLRMAAYCRIHVDLATQRPDAAFLGRRGARRRYADPDTIRLVDDGGPPGGSRESLRRARPDQPLIVGTTEVMTRPTLLQGHLLRSQHHCGGQRTISGRPGTPLSAPATRWPAEAQPQPRSCTQDMPSWQPDWPRSRSPVEDVTVSDLEAEVGRGRIGLLRRRLHDGRWSLSRPVSDLAIRAAPSTHLQPSGAGGCPTCRVLSRHPPGDILGHGSSRPPKSQTPCTRRGRAATGQSTPLSRFNFPMPAAHRSWLFGDPARRWTQGGSTIATADSEVLDRIGALGFSSPTTPADNYGISTGTAGWRGIGLRCSGRFVQLGLLYNKHVPQAYLAIIREATPRPTRRSARCATAVARSDPGGTLSGQGQFANSDRRLIEAGVRAVTSLGIVATVRQVREPGVEAHPTSVAFGRTCQGGMGRLVHPTQQARDPPESEEMLASALGTVPQRRWRHIVSVEPVPSVPVRCITVAADSHLYLAGAAFLPTHNCRDNFSLGCCYRTALRHGAE